MGKRGREEGGGGGRVRGTQECTWEGDATSAESAIPPKIPDTGGAGSPPAEDSGSGECRPGGGSLSCNAHVPDDNGGQGVGAEQTVHCARGEEEGGAEHVDESRYSEDGLGLRVEHISVEECAFLYQEIFVRKAYTKHATLQVGGGAVMDVGANIGLFTLYCSQTLSGASDKIYAFEPIDAIHTVLHRNLRDVQGTVVCRYGLGAFDSASETFVYYPETPGESSRQLAESAAMRSIMGGGESHGGKECRGEIRRLSRVLREHRISRVQLLKIDVEGDELLVLLGIEDEDWHIFQQVVLEVHDVEHRLARVRALLERRGFKVTVEQQKSEWDDGALLLVPLELRLFYVHAVRAK